MTGEVNAPVIAREPHITVYIMVTAGAALQPQPLGRAPRLRAQAGALWVLMRVVTNPALRPLARQEIHSAIPARENIHMLGTSETL